MNSNRSYLVNAIIDWILDNGCTPHIILDTTVEGVDVPSANVTQGRIILNVAPTAIHNFSLIPDGLFLQARFGGIEKHIRAPVVAIIGVYAKENGHGLFFQNEGMANSESETLKDADSPVTTDSAESSNVIQFKKPE
ncbi:MAG: ClpXP protease specificity-enhancing factor SspB [Gammaproteobacteria bacterium]|nr:ClpXP protease specificity-enhancing factor SspB [Gammaproteobacteria bacterium]